MKKIITATLFALAVCSNAIAAVDLKIGYVSVEKLLTQAPQVEVVNTAMIERVGGMKDELQKMEGEIKYMVENYKRNELVMTEDKMNELKSTLIASTQTLKQMEAALKHEV